MSIRSRSANTACTICCGSRQGQKTDANDALSGAVAANHAKTVAIKTERQQGLQTVDRVHQALTKQSMALNNMLIAILYEFGVKLSRRFGEVYDRLHLAIGDGSAFKNGRDAAACIGVTPKQHSTGGKVTSGTVGKNRGNQRLRYTLFQGAMAVLR